MKQLSEELDNADTALIGPNINDVKAMASEKDAFLDQFYRLTGR
jgi:hypothetical protein